MNYYDIHLEKGAKFELNMEKSESVMIFTLLGDVYVNDELIEEKTAVKLVDGDSIEFYNDGEKSQVLYISSKKLEENVCWAGPIVMNTRDEIEKAYVDLENNRFIKEKVIY